WPKIALATRAHTPRCTTTSVLGGIGGPKAATLQPSWFAPVSTFTFAYVVLGGSEKPLASIAVFVPAGIVTSAPGKLCVESLAATAMTPSPVPGEPTRYWFKPLLPAAATTTTPAFAALVAAFADGSSLVPNGEPSDMLITSMSLSTAQSMASTTTSVGPAQPNTRTA